MPIKQRQAKSISSEATSNEPEDKLQSQEGEGGDEGVVVSITRGMLRKQEKEMADLRAELARVVATADVGRLAHFDSKHAKEPTPVVQLRTLIVNGQDRVVIWKDMIKNESYVNPTTGVRFVNQQIEVLVEDDVEEGKEVTIDDFGNAAAAIVMPYDDYQRQYKYTAAEIVSKREEEVNKTVGQTADGTPQVLTTWKRWYTVRRLDNGRVYRDIPDTFIN